MSLLTGRTLLQRYKVQAPIQAGGLPNLGAETGGSPIEGYRAWDGECSGFLALYTLRADMAQEEKIVQRFKHAAQALVQLEHTNIVRVYGVEEDGPLVFYLAELVEGDTLESEIASLGGRIFSLARTLEILRPLCSALEYAHQLGVLHGNLQPANILTGPDGWVLLTQFGAAGLNAAAGPESAVFASGEPASFSGNPCYLSPEQIQGQPPSPQSDIYSLGILLFQLLTGRLPFTGATAGISGSQEERIAWEQVNAQAPSPQEFNPHLSRAVDSAILRCLEKEPARRFSSGSDLMNVLDQAASNSPVVRVPGLLVAVDKNLKVDRPQPASVQQAYTRPMEAFGRDPGESAAARARSTRRAPVLVFALVGLLFILVAAGALIAGQRALSAVPSNTPTATLPPPPSATLPPTPTPLRSMIAGLAVDVQGEAFYQFGSAGAAALQPGLPITGSEAGRIWTGAGTLKLILVDGSPLYLGENTTLALAIPDNASVSRAVLTPGLERGAALLAAQSARVHLQILADSLYRVEAESGAVAGVRFDPLSGGFQVDCLQGVCRIGKQDEAGLALVAGERGSYNKGQPLKRGTAEYEAWRLLGKEIVPTPPTLSTPTPTVTVIVPATPTVTSTIVPPTPMQRDLQWNRPRPREVEPATLAPPA